MNWAQEDPAALLKQLAELDTTKDRAGLVALFAPDGVIVSPSPDSMDQTKTYTGTGQISQWVKGDVASLRTGGFSAAVTGCLQSRGLPQNLIDAEAPAIGRGFFYLVRAIQPNGAPGTYDGEDPGQVAPRDAALGVGRVIAPDNRTPEAIREAVRTVLSDPSYRTNAERLRGEMAALPGPEYAVELLERLAAERRPLPTT